MTFTVPATGIFVQKVRKAVIADSMRLTPGGTTSLKSPTATKITLDMVWVKNIFFTTMYNSCVNTDLIVVWKIN